MRDDPPATQSTIFVCAHLVQFDDGTLVTTVLCRGGRELCEAAADRGPDDELWPKPVVREEVVVRLAAEWDALMAEAAQIEGGSRHVH